jgi:protease-4
MITKLLPESICTRRDSAGTAKNATLRQRRLDGAQQALRADAPFCTLAAMSNRRFGCVSGVLIALLLLSLVVNALLWFAARGSMSGRTLLTMEPPRFDESVVVGGAKTDEKIAVISLRGIITAMEPGAIGESAIDDLKLQMKQAAADAKVRAVVLSIDSPGGEVTASDVLYKAVCELREKKPVVVHMNSLAASGGYYVACGGNWLIANETTLTGSIGVIMQTLNYRALMGKVGLETITFKSGEMKDMLSGSRPITDKEREYVQALVMQTYDRFVGIVANERKLPVDQLRTGIADGRVVTGKDALAAKLIDQLGSVEDAYAKAMELAKISDAPVVRYDAGFNLGRLFRIFGEAHGRGSRATVQVDVAPSLIPKLETGRLYYLPGYYAP